MRKTTAGIATALAVAGAGLFAGTASAAPATSAALPELPACSVPPIPEPANEGLIDGAWIGVFTVFNEVACNTFDVVHEVA